MFEETTGDFNTENCKLGGFDGKFVTCKCDHMSDYAILQTEYIKTNGSTINKVDTKNHNELFVKKVI